MLFSGKKHSDSIKKFSKTDIINMFVFFGLTTYLVCLVDIPLGTNCAPLLADLFVYSYEADFIQGFSRKTKKS